MLGDVRKEAEEEDGDEAPDKMAFPSGRHCKEYGLLEGFENCAVIGLYGGSGGIRKGIRVVSLWIDT